MSVSKIAMMCVAVSLAGAFASAQAPLPASPKMTTQEKANLQLVRDWWRLVFQARHAEVVDKFADPNMIQHNPNMPNGTGVLKQFLSRATPVNPIPDKLMTEPEMQLAQGDIVLLVWGHDAKDPTDPSKMYHYDSFDAFRVKDGKIVEHWDSAMKNPPAARRGGAPEGGAPPANR